MKVLIVGATGFIGSALFRAAHDAGHQVMGTGRRLDCPLSFYHYDLLDPLAGELPLCDVAYLCAGIADYRKSEGNAEAWRVNVDGNMACAKRLAKAGAFIVYPSSVAAEWAHGTAYGRAKVAVEHFLQAITEPAIVRFDRVTAERLPKLCNELVIIGATRRAGIHHL